MRLTQTLALASLASAASVDDFDWATVSPSRNLAFQPCYSEYECARLELPLNWANTSDPRRATIAVIKLPANVPQSDKTHGGSILTNPGGPGGTGVGFLLSEGKRLQSVVGSPGKRVFDLISFDPRGVLFSTPYSDCFGDNDQARVAYTYEQRGSQSLQVVPDGGVKEIAYALAVKGELGRRCKARNDAGETALEFVGSPSVVRDMIVMVDELDRLRKMAGGHNVSNGHDTPRMQYVGFSYGTALGNYFASMFPGRVGKMVLDGVLDASDYANGDGWFTSGSEQDEIWATFIKECYQHGSSLCPFAHKSDKSPADIKMRFAKLLARLEDTPVSTADSSGNAIVITAADIKNLVFNAMYSPYQTFLLMGQALNEVDHGIYTNVADQLIPSVQAGLDTACKAASNTTKPRNNLATEAGDAIYCIDGDNLNNKTARGWQEYLHKQKNISAIGGASVAGIRFDCAKWPFKSAYDFKGPFKSPAPVSKPKSVAGRPEYPILFLSNRLDPITPLSSARAVSKGHPGSRIVIQETIGHTALASEGVSDCTINNIKDYFVSDKVPTAKETSCKSACSPWDPASCPTSKEARDLTRASNRSLRPDKFPFRV